MKKFYRVCIINKSFSVDSEGYIIPVSNYNKYDFSTYNEAVHYIENAFIKQEYTILEIFKNVK